MPNPNYFIFYYNRGLVYLYLEQYELAIQDCDKALELNSNFAPTYINRGIIYFELGNYESAFNDYNKAIEYKPDYVNAYLDRGLILGTKGRFDEALYDFNKVIEYDKNQSMAYYGRGLIYYEEGEYEKALNDLNRAKALGDTKAQEVITEINDLLNKQKAASAGKGDPVDFISVKFFEEGPNLPQSSEFKFNTAFSKKAARYVYAFITVKNNLYNIKDQKPGLAAKFYKPDGTFWGDSPSGTVILSSWKEADIWVGWGWDNPGYWDAGVYRIDIYLGNKKIGEGKFAIYE